MDVNKFTESARNCVMRAQGKAVAYDHNIIKPLHLLSALSEEQMIKEILSSNKIEYYHHNQHGHLYLNLLLYHLQQDMHLLER